MSREGGDATIVTPVKAGRDRDFAVWVNIIAPYIAKVSDGKAPDLGVIADEFAEVVEKAVRRVGRPPRAEGDSHKARILEVLDEAIVGASEGGHRFSQRNLLYEVRPLILERGGAAPSWGRFCSVLTEKELEDGHDIPGMTRIPRGTFIEPHGGAVIPLGTTAVENYKRPAWRFNKVLFVEKEGPLGVLRSEGWANRNDIALVSSKGQPTRAVRDLFDPLGDTNEEVAIFALHDADAAGTIILRPSVKRPLRVQPDECRSSTSGCSRGGGRDGAAHRAHQVKKTPAIARDIKEPWRTPYGYGRGALTQRAENESAALMARREDGRVRAARAWVPPEVLGAKLDERVRERLVEQERERILREANLEQLVDNKMAELKAKLAEARASLANEIADSLEDEPEQSWADAVDQIAEEIAPPARPPDVNPSNTKGGSDA